MDKGLYNRVVLFDIKKAFDTVDHDILLSKLRRYRVVGIELEWFMSYLTDRKQSCTLSGENSSFKIVKYGIPQGVLSWSTIVPDIYQRSSIGFEKGYTVHVRG